MSDMGKTKKLCANGHLMDPAWEVCPYCPGSQSRAELDPTVRVDNPHPPPTVAASGGGRKTEIMDRPPVIEGVGWLVGIRDGNKGRTHRIDGERVTVGAAADCEVVLRDEHVSDRHASVRFRDREFVLTDLDSTNGTFVNEEGVQQQPISDGDRVRFGSSEWVFKCVVFDEA